jgi:hypothetical protein
MAHKLEGDVVVELEDAEANVTTGPEHKRGRKHQLLNCDYYLPNGY